MKLVDILATWIGAVFLILLGAFAGFTIGVMYAWATFKYISIVNLIILSGVILILVIAGMRDQRNKLENALTEENLRHEREIKDIKVKSSNIDWIISSKKSKQDLVNDENNQYELNKSKIKTEHSFFNWVIRLRKK